MSKINDDDDDDDDVDVFVVTEISDCKLSSQKQTAAFNYYHSFFTLFM